MHAPESDTMERPAAAEAPAPSGRDPASAAWFRARLAEVGETQGSLARLMQRCGDDRTPKNILRSIQRMAAGDARVSGEMRVILHMLHRGRQKAAKRRQAAPDT